MSGYSVASLVKPAAGRAHIECFFTAKGKDIYVMLPQYRSTVLLRDLKLAAGATASVLGSSKPLPLTRLGAHTRIDLSGFKPGEIAADLLVIKISNAL